MYIFPKDFQSFIELITTFKNLKILVSLVKTMTPYIENNLQKFIPLESADLNLFLSKCELKVYAKNECFIKIGKKCDYLGFIVKGALVCVYDKDGDEIIDEFSLENEFIADYKNFIDVTNAEKDVRCIENSEILVIQREDLYELYEKHHNFERVGRLIAESLFKNWQEKSISLVMDDAKKRYQKLINSRPTLVQRVPQYLIASYLGITPQSLSRIRKEK